MAKPQASILATHVQTRPVIVDARLHKVDDFSASILPRRSVGNPLVHIVIEARVQLLNHRQTRVGKQPCKLRLSQRPHMGWITKPLDAIVQCRLLGVLTAEQVGHEDTTVRGKHASHFDEYTLGSWKVMEGRATRHQIKGRVLKRQGLRIAMLETYILKTTIRSFSPGQAKEGIGSVNTYRLGTAARECQSKKPRPAGNVERPVGRADTRDAH